LESWTLGEGRFAGAGAERPQIHGTAAKRSRELADVLKHVSKVRAVIATDVVKDMEGFQEPQESDRDAFCRMGKEMDLLVMLRALWAGVRCVLIKPGCVLEVPE